MTAWILGLVLIGCGTQPSTPTPQATPAPAPAADAEPTSSALTPGMWTAAVQGPGGPVRFGLFLSVEGDAVEAVIHNGEEQLSVGETTWKDGTLRMRLDPYDAEIVAESSAQGLGLTGTWTKQKRGDKQDTLPFFAVPGAAMAPHQAGPDPLTGRWRVTFSSDPDTPAVGLFDSTDQGLTGTFLTTLGDYRYLAGQQQGNKITLTTFDGSHAFRFTASQAPDGTLAGDFWSGSSWHETWTAVRDDDIALPDANSLTTVADPSAWATMTFTDLEGQTKTLADEDVAGKLQIINLFGSWCPNCNDEAPVLAALHNTYRDRGLSVVGIAFEHGDNPTRDAIFVQRYADRHGITFPLWLGGSSDKAKASEAFGLLDKIRAYPTTLFVVDGVVKKVHTGFSGPAAGPEHAQLMADWTETIEGLL